MTTTPTRLNNDAPTRKTLASQLDRLDDMLQGLDSALTGAVQEAVEQAVKQAVQAVLTEVLTNRQLQEELQRASQPAPPPQEPRDKPNLSNRIWQATTAGVRRTVQTIQQGGRGAGMALVAAGGVVAGVLYAARAKIASLAKTVYRHGKRLVQGAIAALTSFLPSFAFGAG
ncbi:MAG: hypothetical protein ACYC3I_17100 [Gemmataceae bacterium]